MKAITLSVNGFFNARLARLTAGHRDADLIEQIAPEMLRHLVAEGIARAVWTIVLYLPAFYFLERVVAPLIMNVDKPLATAYYVLFFGVVLVGYIVSWRKLALASVDREILYYRLNRRWRWER